MIKLYCTECGAPNPYSLNKPKYCGNCGSKFSASIEEKKVDEPKLTESNQEDFSDIDYVPQIKSLDFEVLDTKPQNITIQDIIGTANRIDANNVHNNSKQIETNKDFLDRFKQEAGAIKPRNRNFKNNANQKG